MSSSGIDRAFERRLATLINTREPRVLQNGLKGVEKESLRVAPDGRLEHSPHPVALGSALSHEHITTDYSESLIELVTPAFRESWQLLCNICATCISSCTGTWASSCCGQPACPAC